MQINKVGFEPNFKAQFVQNSNMEKITDKIYNNSKNDGRDLASELELLASHHKNALLLVDVVPEATIKGITFEPRYVVTNLKTNKSITVPLNEFDLDTIKSMNNQKSKNYQTLFVDTDSKINIQKIMKKYFVPEQNIYKSHSSK